MKVLDQIEEQLDNLRHTIDIDRYDDELGDVLSLLCDIQESAESDPPMMVRTVKDTSLTYWS